MIGEFIGPERRPQRDLTHGLGRPGQNQRPLRAQRPTNRDPCLACDIRLGVSLQLDDQNRLGGHARGIAHPFDASRAHLLEILALKKPRQRAPRQPVDPPRALIQPPVFGDQHHNQPFMLDDLVQIGFDELHGCGGCHGRLLFLRHGMLTPHGRL